jgi:ribosome-associated protein
MTRKSRRSPSHEGDDEEPDLAINADSDSAEEGPSRTARKNASEELQRLGEQLLTLRPSRLAALALPERLQDAIEEARRLTNFGAKRRQVQFIGKLMRKLEPESLAAIRKAVRPQ